MENARVQIFIHELSSIRKRTSERSERVEFSDTAQRVNKKWYKAFSMV